MNIKEIRLKKLIRKASMDESIKRETINYQGAKRIGLLIQTDEELDGREIDTYIRKMEKNGVLVNAIVYNNKKAINYHYDFPYTEFSAESFDWKGELIDERVKKYINTNFDFLFCLSDSISLELAYVLSHSKAKCRVGRSIDYFDELFELMIGGGDSIKLNDLFKTMLQYVELITKNHVN